jgi:tetratricopeptide (TPR) repeat protein
MLGRSEDARRYADLQVLWKGKIAFWTGDWQTAEYYLTSASKRIERSDEVWYFLAETCRRLNKRAAAITSYQRCLSLNPQHGGAHRGLAMLGE